jgi:hypothetical protein
MIYLPTCVYIYMHAVTFYTMQVLGPGLLRQFIHPYKYIYKAI